MLQLIMLLQLHTEMSTVCEAGFENVIFTDILHQGRPYRRVCILEVHVHNQTARCSGGLKIILLRNFLYWRWRGDAQAFACIKPEITFKSVNPEG